MGTYDRRIFSRSWKLMTSESGWFKPLLIMAVAMLVPVAGVLGVIGYSYEWARLVAWGADSAPKRKDVHVGGLIGAGWRVFLIMWLWMMVWMVAYIVLMMIGAIGGPILTLLFAVVGLVSLVFYAPLVIASIMRGSIYTKITAGLNPARAFELVRRDPKGIFAYLGVQVLASLVVGIVEFLLMLPVSAAVAPYMHLFGATAAQLADPIYILGMFLYLYPAAWVAVVPLFYLLMVVTMGWSLFSAGALGLWMRQFNLPAWGGPSDPLPQSTPVTPSAQQPAQGAVQQSAQSAPVQQYGAPSTNQGQQNGAYGMPGYQQPQANEPATGFVPAYQQPVEPVQAVVPGQPAQANETVQPVVAAQPSVPAQPTEPEQPMTPVQSNQQVPPQYAAYAAQAQAPAPQQPYQAPVTPTPIAPAAAPAAREATEAASAASTPVVPAASVPVPAPKPTMQPGMPKVPAYVPVQPAAAQPAEQSTRVVNVAPTTQMPAQPQQQAAAPVAPVAGQTFPAAAPAPVAPAAAQPAAPVRPVVPPQYPQPQVPSAAQAPQVSQPQAPQVPQTQGQSAVPPQYTAAPQVPRYPEQNPSQDAPSSPQE